MPDQSQKVQHSTSQTSNRNTILNRSDWSRKSQQSQSTTLNRPVTDEHITCLTCHKKYYIKHIILTTDSQTSHKITTFNLSNQLQRQSQHQARQNRIRSLTYNMPDQSQKVQHQTCHTNPRLPTWQTRSSHPEDNIHQSHDNIQHVTPVTKCTTFSISNQ